MKEFAYKLAYLVSTGLGYYKTRFWGLFWKHENFCIWHWYLCL